MEVSLSNDVSYWMEVSLSNGVSYWMGVSPIDVKSVTSLPSLDLLCLLVLLGYEIKVSSHCPFILA
jgi:hypothetical protein